MECSPQVCQSPPLVLASSTLLHRVFPWHVGPISEDDFFTWEALIIGPKDTPFVRASSIQVPCATNFSLRSIHRRVAFLPLNSRLLVHSCSARLHDQP